jgi:YVTN family beta-propeller protein
MAIGSAASLEAAAMNKLRWRHAAVPAALMCCAGALVTGSAPMALAAAGQAVSRAGRAGPAASGLGLVSHQVSRAGRASQRASGSGRADGTARAVAGPGTSLLLNPGAQAGDVSARGWDAVTIPGWRVASGLPTVVRYGTPRFPRAGRWPAVRGGHLFAGGAGGTARLRQQVPLRPAAGRALPAGTRYRLSAWLGGTARSRAAVRVTFLSAAGRVLGRRAISSPGRSWRKGGLGSRMAAGPLPPGTASARVTLVLATSLTDIDGPDAPLVGYDRAVADDLRFSVSAAVRRPPPLTPSHARIPRYQHVFLFYFENEGFRSIIGNTRKAPFLNSLLPHASVLANFFAEEHPSDGNYLALAGGSTFGIPLDDPLEENPHYTIHARNIGDLVDAAHETWKGYLQSAAGPCDNTVHKYYWDDDLPMTYFADVRDRPAYCAAHMVPLQSLRTDLASAASTPSFSWVSPNDCADMEGCGIRAGDDFLARELGAIMRSPAWRTQRSLAIITFDEDHYDHQRPAQRVPTLILGSSGVRRGYVSHARYTHYSLLRTIEAALGLGTLTRNDRYAQPVSDVFGPSSPARHAGPAAARPVTRRAAAKSPAARRPASGPVPARADRKPASAGTARPRARHRQQTAFVANSVSGTVTPVGLATRRAGRPIRVGKDPQAIAVTPDGRTAFVANAGSGTVTPVDTATRRAGPPIRVGRDPVAIAVTPNGRTAYVANSGSGTVTPITTASRRAGRPIRVGTDPQAIAVTPDGRTAYVLDWGSAAVTPIDTATGRAGPPIPVGAYPVAITIAPDGATAYVASYGSDTVTPITIATGRPGRAVPAGQAPDALAVTPDGRTVYAVGGDSDAVTPITAVTGHAGHRIPVGYSPAAIAISRSGRTAFVVNTISGTVTPVSTRTGRAGRPIPAGLFNYPTAIALAPSGSTAVVIGTYAGQVTLINTRTRHEVARINVGSFPVAVAIAG